MLTWGSLPIGKMLVTAHPDFKQFNKAGVLATFLFLPFPTQLSGIFCAYLSGFLSRRILYCVNLLKYLGKNFCHTDFSARDLMVGPTTVSKQALSKARQFIKDLMVGPTTPISMDSTSSCYAGCPNALDEHNAQRCSRLQPQR